MSGCAEDPGKDNCAGTGYKNDAGVESEEKPKAGNSKADEKDFVGDEVDVPLLARDSKLVVYNWVMDSPPPYEHIQDEKLYDEKDDVEDSEKWWAKIRITGSCLCKLFVVIYLMACLLVSALYIAIYGPNELFYMPEAPQHQPEVTLPQTVPPRFYDNPYTEWHVQRLPYNVSHFANWSVLPDSISDIHQLATGVVQGRSGFWILDSDGLYFSTRLEASSSSFSNVSKILGLNVSQGSRLAMASTESLFLISSESITLLDCSAEDSSCVKTNSWQVPDYGCIHDAVVSLNDNVLWIGTDTGLYRMDPDSSVHENGTIVVEVQEVEGKVLSLAWRSSLSSVQDTGKERSAFIFSNFSVGPNQNVSFSTGGSLHISSSSEPGFGLLVVGTEERVIFYNGRLFRTEWVSQWEDGLGGVVDGPVISIAVALSGEIFLGSNVSVSRVNSDYTVDRFGPKQGLPYNHITSLFFSPISVKMPPATLPPCNITADVESGTVWVGTEKGFTLFDVFSSKFISYHFGPRWHPGQSVLGLTGDDHSTLILTDSGLSVLTAEEWTLEEKADHFQSMISRHVREPGLASDCPLESFSPNTCSPVSTDNGGLWTSWLAASEAFRYQVTENHQAQSNSWSFFQGLKFLVQVTGVDGLPARSVVKENQTISGPHWHNSSTKPEWMWKGDTSSDEIVGHMFAYPIVYDLVASSDEEKQEVTAVLESIIDHIRSNDYYLVDITNQSTRWGVWAPEQLNLNRSWSDDRGINSLQILSYLLSAFRVTGKEEYLSAWKELHWTPEGTNCPTDYGLNMVNCKITFPRDINYSDDELTFLPYFTFFQALKNLPEQASNPEYSQLLNLSLHRTWDIMKKERSAAWTAIYSYATGNKSQPIIEDIVWNLRTWPLELVEWPTTNSHRLDICLDPEQDRNFATGSQSMHVLPANERTQLRWNGNPYQLDWEGSSTEMDPGPWLMPYWLAKWTQLL